MEKPFNVLSLEDSDFDFEIISEQLIKAGYNLNISRAETEDEFLQSIKNKKYDIILADYNLPQFDAFGALKICNAYCPDVPFICVSGSIGEIMAIELLKMGAVDYVIKDRLERLPFAVKRALEEAEEKKALRLADEELKKKEENFRTLTENIPDIIARFDKNLRHIYINPAIEKITGISSDAFIGKTNEELGMPADKVVFWNKHLQNAFKTGLQQTFEFSYQAPGGIVYFSALVVPEFDENGSVNTLLSVTRDVSETKRAEIALKKNEERLRDIIFSNADWVWEVDANGRYTYSSQHDIDLFGLTPGEIIGKTPFDLMPEDEANRVRPLFQKIAEKRTPIKDLENWNIGKNGERICLLTNGVPVFDVDGQFTGYRGVDKNITERKNAEKELLKAKELAEASDKLKTAFLNNISHELRTPLNGILGFADLISETGVTADEKQHYLKILRKSTNRLINTMTDYMDISLITSGNMVRNDKVLVLNDLIKILTEVYSERCLEKELHFYTEFDSTENIFIETDGELLQKALHHLLDNALKFTKEGKIIFSCLPTESSIKFTISDTGIGIENEMQKAVFERFTQESISISSEYEGSGLGLSISKGIINLLGGNIALESKKGVGTEINFSLPREKIQSNNNQLSEPKSEPKSDRTVLVAEDDYFNLLYIEKLLENTGLKTISAANGRIAVETCRQNEKIDLVLMDLKMPVMDGYEATRLIKEFRPGLNIIAITAHAMSGDEYTALQAGCNDYLTKPFDSHVFYSKISKFINIGIDKI